MNDNALVKLRQITQTYRSGRKEFVAIRDVNITVGESEFVALLGPSGCGKSTLLRITTGLQKPTEGRVLYRGRPLDGVNPHATIVFQTFALFPWLTVRQNVEVALKPRGFSPEQRAQRAEELISLVGLDGFETAFPRELSGGMRQKVGFARALAVAPELLCLDEPFSALDVLSAESLRGELLEMWTSGTMPTKAILMVTHSIEEAVFMSDRIVVMDKEPGRVVADVIVDLPHPRDRSSPRFAALVDHAYATLAGQTQPEHVEIGTAPGQPGRTRALPNVPVDVLETLLEYVADLGKPADLFRLTEALHIDSDYVLRLSEAAELLGFATVAQGDIDLTPLGEAFAEARIVARREIFATRLRRLPLIQWLLGLLNAANDRRLEYDVALKALELEFPPDEAERQLDLAIEWGRYAELLQYDDDGEVLYLESDQIGASR
ncbi:MAG: ATP-binding cassette domain-containing protein [Chthonomonadales bacterium]|nr:ATP-binding cassette domain-containing protein [Chthonomonadales bacterium]